MKTIFSAVLAATFACSIFTSCANSNTEKLLGNWQLTFFEKDGAMKYFTKVQGKEWTGGDVFDDFC